jgi:glycosyltransferase involved in cell wall biosynthesis
VKILFFTDNFPPEVNAPASRTFEHCRHWATKGHKITVITCAPNFPQGKVFDGYKNKLWQVEQVEGIKVVRVWSYIAPNAGFVKRILDFVSYMVMAMIAGFFVGRPDVIIGTSPQLFTVCAAWFTGLWRRVPYVFELRDLWPESIKAVGAMRQSYAITVLEKLEMFLYRRAAMIVAVTNAFKQNLVSRGIDGSKILVVTNGVDLARFQPGPKDVSLTAQLGLENCFVAGYVGTHGLAHSLETLVDAAELLERDHAALNIRIIFIGNGAAKPGLVTYAEGKRLNNVMLLDSVSKDQIPAYWSLLDCSIIHLRNTPLFSTVIPSKMFESFGCGIPVLLGVAGEAAEILEASGAGFTFEPENAAQLAQSLVILATDKAKLQELSSHGIIAARKFDRIELADTMLSHLETVAITA